ncbi:MAG TPA: ABC transporter substrate-binding protein [Thermoplasmata archaeon]|nr:ABC transporter substrate-binding protein [Thermoplasmata archaeon]
MIALTMVVASFAVPVGNMTGRAVADDPIIYSIGTTLVPDDFNPFEMTTGISYSVLWMTYEFLITPGPKQMEPHEQLASSWEATEGSTVWTYHLVTDSVFHDGHPVTADDVAFTFNLIIDNDVECGMFAAYVKNITSVTAPDLYTVVMELESPRADMECLTVPILPEHLWGQIDTTDLANVDMFNEDVFPDGPIGSGPFRLVEYQRTEGLVRMTAWDQYHWGKVNIDELRMVIYTQPSAMITALETGAIDLAMGVPPTFWDSVISLDNIDGQAAPSLDLTEFGSNCAPKEIRESVNEQGKPNFPQASDNYETCNRAVRQAMAIAINETYINEHIMLNLSTVGSTLIPPATPFWHLYLDEDEKWSNDLDEARQLLEDAGYKYISDDEVRENETSGELLDFDFYYISSTEQDTNAAHKISDWLADIGIKAEPQGVMEGTLYTYWFGMVYDLFIWNWQPDVDPTFLLSVLTTDEIPKDSKDKTAWSDCYYSNPVYDQLFIDQQKALNITQRQEIVHEMQRIVYYDCPYEMLWYPSGLDAYRTDEFTNFPDMTANAGISPDTFWFYYEIYKIGTPVAPRNVNAGEDTTCFLGDVMAFTGDATDVNDAFDTLAWEWEFDDAGEVIPLDGQTVVYTFDNIGTVNVTLTVTDPGGLSGTDTMTVTVAEVPEDAGWIKGYVNSSTGSPVVGANVVVGTVSHQTDATGLYSFTISEGVYTVNVTKSGFTGDTENVTVVAGAISWRNFTLAAVAGNVKGYVIDLETGLGIENAIVEMTYGGEEESYTTNATGYFEFNVVPAGTYNITAMKSGYDENSSSVTVVAGETTMAEIQLEVASSGGLSTAAMAVIGALVVVIAAVAAISLLKRRKGEMPPSSDEEGFEPPPPE